MNYIVLLSAITFLIEINLSDTAVPSSIVDGVTGNDSGKTRKNNRGNVEVGARANGVGNEDINVNTGSNTDAGLRGSGRLGSRAGTENATRRGVARKNSRKSRASTQNRSNNNDLLLNLMNKAAPLNPAGIASALSNAPSNELTQIQPILKRIIETVMETPLQFIFSDFNSLLNMSRDGYLNTVLNLPFSILAALGDAVQQLIGTTALTAGRIIKSSVDFADDGTSLITDTLRVIPGLNVAGNILKPAFTATNAVISIADATGTTLRENGKRERANAQAKRIQREAARRLLTSTV